jgi:hypothetical protein
MKHERCPELYSCPKVKMTPMIRALLRCTAAEAMESICTSCERWHVEGEPDYSFVASSGRRVKVVIEKGRVDLEETLAGAPARH